MAEEQADRSEVVEIFDDALNEHDPHYEPIITLPEVNIPTLEEEEEELIKLRAKLFRFDKNEVPPEWKERGTGDIKLLRHTSKNSVRVVMRRDKTLKLCANHYVKPWMELKPSHGSDRAWVYSVEGDFADGEVKQELFAVRFANAENAKKWKEKFEEAKVIVDTLCDSFSNGSNRPLVHDSEVSDESSSDEDNEVVKEVTKDSKEENLIGDVEKLKVNDSGDAREVIKDSKEENVIKGLEKLNVDESGNAD